MLLKKKNIGRVRIMSNENITITKAEFKALKNVTEICSDSYWARKPPSNIGARGWIEEAERVIAKHKDET